jgi:hypothetical protein
VSGNGVLLTGHDDEESRDPTTYNLGPGDFAFIPAWTEYQTRNESEDQDLVWVIIQSGATPVEVRLSEWGGYEVGEDA